MVHNVAVVYARTRDSTSQFSCIIHLPAIAGHRDYGSGVKLHPTVTRYTE
jgi:hypothetical protein